MPTLQDPDDALDRLAALVSQRQQAMAEIDAIVVILRSTNLEGTPDCTWDEIADALGVSKQVVWRKYAHLM